MSLWSKGLLTNCFSGLEIRPQMVSLSWGLPQRFIIAVMLSSSFSGHLMNLAPSGKSHPMTEIPITTHQQVIVKGHIMPLRQVVQGTLLKWGFPAPTIVLCDREKDAKEGGQNGSQWGQSNRNGRCLLTSWGTWVCSQLGFLTLNEQYPMGPGCFRRHLYHGAAGAPQVLPPQDARGFGAPANVIMRCDDRNRAAHVGHGWRGSAGEFFRRHRKDRLW